MTDDDEKRSAALAAAELCQAGMVVGLGTGSTVAHLIPALAARHLAAEYVATSRATALAARSAGLALRPFGSLERLDLAIDGADQIDPDGWLIKGGGGAHTREKIVAVAAERFVVIVSSAKVVERLVAPVPLELLDFGLDATLHALGEARLRDAPASPDGGVLADYLGEIDDPRRLAERLSSTPGIVEHGLFPPELVSEVLIGTAGGVHRRRAAG